MTLQHAIELAKVEQSAGNIIRMHVVDGCLSVETDQGWRTWFDPREVDPYLGSNDTLGD